MITYVVIAYLVLAILMVLNSSRKSSKKCSRKGGRNCSGWFGMSDLTMVELSVVILFGIAAGNALAGMIH